MKSTSAVSGKDQDSKLLDCCSKGRKNDIVPLLDQGANENAQAEDSWYTPLHFAIESGSVESVECLLENGAEPNKTNKEGKTPLHLASASGNKKSIECLLLYGANKFLKDSKGDLAVNVCPVDCYELFGATKPPGKKGVPSSAGSGVPAFSLEIFPEKNYSGARVLAPASVTCPAPHVEGREERAPAPAPAPAPVERTPAPGPPPSVPAPVPRPGLPAPFEGGLPVPIGGRGAAPLPPPPAFPSPLPPALPPAPATPSLPP
eukprot:CAMPEP_0201523300 /NCGR_PEP_ID=MMETSP0161_2-20130828/19302_1 /ASSEMBLY_ACC=CAM_ASM_000251 /TAXON_ID=180227 /ORGANISM="Neoparamoeba aestuarina, Strain SoJaBio B1-5/56/2" /LENGTH=260 /DNA_ID=CAMNT_0047922371 /DNA_START=69 /DNA_END=848 /DNA_ORIENTATION=-